MTMLEDNEELQWKRGVWGLSSLAVFLVFGIYEGVVYMSGGGSLFPRIMPSNIPVILGFVTTFSITMTGFIAAIGAYLLTVSRTPAFTEWREEGYLSVFFHLYGAAIVFLLLTFGLCILMALNNMNIVWLKFILCTVLVNLIHIILITIIVVNQAKFDDGEDD
ncbi:MULTISPECIES: hypothetical protein [Vibrio]|uniref:hypothetical protein n=1 Tax=Vibrio TaxID=662 RepID=UPI0006987E3E|nr:MULTISPECIES: hypothetical protein [Vibrio]MBE4460511.1 hypothetical protein [Vibrio parahaemolyticus]MCX8905881.1 hypothetical protein [Vibrio parahaemolyticus]MDN4705717.1 hypothetical protein [Vibrio parahaemolyticus]MDN4713639.1 hypothetical protein [Vibrio parahaemolyticus]MDN4717531.1 hypothetical protein [Vibrio parahaemolyticus]